MAGIPTTNIKSPVLSPSLNEFGEALLTDESGNVLEIVAAVQIDASAHSNLGTAVVGKGKTSQVTGRQQSAIVTTPTGSKKIRMVGLVSLDSAGNPIPFVAAAAASAAAVSGKFQSGVRTATGASESIAHGLGVVPSLVHVAIYDNTGVATVVVTEGVHTLTNVLVTVTANAKYKVIAFA